MRYICQFDRAEDALQFSKGNFIFAQNFLEFKHNMFKKKKYRNYERSTVHSTSCSTRMNMGPRNSSRFSLSLRHRSDSICATHDVRCTSSSRARKPSSGLLSSESVVSGRLRRMSLLPVLLIRFRNWLTWLSLLLWWTLLRR